MEAKIILRNTMLVSFEGRGYCHMECSSIDPVLLAQNMKLGGEHFKEVEGRYTGFCILSAQSTRFNATEQVKILNIILWICTKLGPRLRENSTHDPLRQATGETFPHFMLLRTLI